MVWPVSRWKYSNAWGLWGSMLSASHGMKTLKTGGILKRYRLFGTLVAEQLHVKHMWTMSLGPLTGHHVWTQGQQAGLVPSPNVGQPWRTTGGFHLRRFMELWRKIHVLFARQTDVGGAQCHCRLPWLPLISRGKLQSSAGSTPAVIAGLKTGFIWSPGESFRDGTRCCWLLGLDARVWTEFQLWQSTTVVRSSPEWNELQHHTTTTNPVPNDCLDPNLQKGQLRFTFYFFYRTIYC